MDSEVLNRAIQGDQAALGQLLLEETPGLLRYLADRIGNRYQSVVDAEDVVQITHVEAFIRIRSFKPAGPGSFSAWLRQIAENNLRDAIKAEDAQKRPPPARRVAPRASDESYVDLFERIAVTSTTPSRDAQKHEIRDAVDGALRKLPTSYEQVLRITEIEGLSGEEAAARMGKKPGTLRVLKLRAMQRLAELLSAKIDRVM